MLTMSRSAAILLLLLSLFHSPLLAQEGAPESRPAPAVTVAVTAGRLRLTAASDAVAVRLEVYTTEGQRLFDSGFKPGTLLDWAMPGGQGPRYYAGAYLCVVTTKGLDSRVSQRLGTLSVTADNAASLEPTEAAQLSAAQRQVLGVGEEGGALTVLREG